MNLENCKVKPTNTDDDKPFSPSFMAYKSLSAPIKSTDYASKNSLLSVSPPMMTTKFKRPRSQSSCLAARVTQAERWSYNAPWNAMI
jgi:hypothetical protein